MFRVMKKINCLRLLRLQLVLLLFGTYATRKQLRTIIRRQQVKGYRKYGFALADQRHDAYDWAEMAVEEIADFQVYILKMKKKI